MCTWLLESFAIWVLRWLMTCSLKISVVVELTIDSGRVFYWAIVLGKNELLKQSFLACGRRNYLHLLWCLVGHTCRAGCKNFDAGMVTWLLTILNIILSRAALLVWRLAHSSFWTNYFIPRYWTKGQIHSKPCGQNFKLVQSLQIRCHLNPKTSKFMKLKKK